MSREKGEDREQGHIPKAVQNNSYQFTPMLIKEHRFKEPWPQ